MDSLVQKTRTNELHPHIVVGLNTIKRTIQVNGHSLKLQFCMFKRSQMKHNNLDCHNLFWNIFH
jgi:hypothetical protein